MLLIVMYTECCLRCQNYAVAVYSRRHVVVIVGRNARVAALATLLSWKCLLARRGRSDGATVARRAIVYRKGDEERERGGGTRRGSCFSFCLVGQSNQL